MSGNTLRRGWFVVWIGLLSGWGSNGALAGPVAAAFDAPQTIAARDVTSLEFSIARPGEKLIEVALPVSFWITRGRESDLRSMVITVHSPERRGLVMDFAPRTELTTDYLAPISGTTIEQEQTQAALAGQAGWPLATAWVGGSAKWQSEREGQRRETYDRLPPRQPRVTSGTMNQGHGTFFKFEPSSQFTLGGEHLFRLQLAVPQAWRGDYLVVTGQAEPLDGPRLPPARMIVGLFLEADPDARVIVAQLVETSAARIRRGSPPPVGSQVVQGLLQGRWPPPIEAVPAPDDATWREAIVAVRQLAGVPR